MAWAWLGLAAHGVPSSAVLPLSERFTLTEVAASEPKWADVAISEGHRIFVVYPRPTEGALPFSVAERAVDGRLSPFPDQPWNAFFSEENVQDRFVSAEAVRADRRGRLWILDAGTAETDDAVRRGAKLVAVNLETNAVSSVVRFAVPSVSADSHLSGLCVDGEQGFAYIGDSGAGGLLVVDLSSGKQRKLLTNHPSTRWERTALMLGGVPWMVDGRVPQRHVHALALSPDRRFLYYQALSSRTLYRLPTAVLQNFDVSEADIAAAVERVARLGAIGGIAFDRLGNLYFSALESAAVHRWTAEGALQFVAGDPDRWEWLGALRLAPDGSFYVMTPERLFRLERSPSPDSPESHDNRRGQSRE